MLCKTLYDVTWNTQDDISKNVLEVLCPYSESKWGPMLLGYQHSPKSKNQKSKHTNMFVCTTYAHSLIPSRTLFHVFTRFVWLNKLPNKQTNTEVYPLPFSFILSSPPFCVCNMDPIWDGQPWLSWWRFPPGHPIGRWARSSLVWTQPLESSGTTVGTASHAMQIWYLWTDRVL